MKYPGCIPDFTRQRNADLLQAYRRHLHDAHYILMPDIFARVAASPARRFWVSEERATVIVNTIIAGRPLPAMRDNKLEMFREIYRRFLALRDLYPQKSVYSLVSEVVNQPAPRFYLTPRSVGEIIYRIKKGWYDKRFDRYKKDNL